MFKRYNGTEYVDPTNFRRWTGTEWVDISSAKRWTGTEWVVVYPTGISLTYQLNDGETQTRAFVSSQEMKDFIRTNRESFTGHMAATRDSRIDINTNMENMFGACYYITSLDLSSFDTTNVTNMENMFGACYYITSLDLSNFNTSSVTNMSNMFSSCRELVSVDVLMFDTTSVVDMSHMFEGCRSFTSLDLSSFDTTNVANMYTMFSGCTALTTAYARTQADADKFNASSNKETNVNFIVKP